MLFGCSVTDWEHPRPSELVDRNRPSLAVGRIGFVQLANVTPTTAGKRHDRASVLSNSTCRWAGDIMRKRFPARDSSRVSSRVPRATALPFFNGAMSPSGWHNGARPPFGRQCDKAPFGAAVEERSAVAR